MICGGETPPPRGRCSAGETPAPSVDALNCGAGPSRPRRGMVDSAGLCSEVGGYGIIINMEGVAMDILVGAGDAFGREAFGA